MKQIRIAFSLLILSLLALSAQAEPAGEVHWIDVRTPAEFAEDHIESTTLIPHEGIAQGVAELGLDKDATIYLFCRSGRRSGLAREALMSLGYTGVVNVGGIEDARKLREKQR